MELLNWLRGSNTRAADDHPLSGGSYLFFFGAMSSDRLITELSALQMVTVYSCVRILAEATAGLPLPVYT